MTMFSDACVAGATEIWKPVQLKKISASDADMFNTLYRICTGDILISDERWEFSMGPGRAIIDTESPYLLRASGEWLGYPFEILFPKWLFRHTLNAELGQTEGLSVTPDIFEAVAHNIVGLWLSALPFQDQLKIDKVDLQSLSNITSELTQLRLVLRKYTRNPIMAIRAEVSVALHGNILREIVRQWGHLLHHREDSVLESVRLPLCLDIGSVQFGLGTLHSLSVGDTVFFDQHPSLENMLGIIITIFGKSVLHADIDFGGSMTMRDMENQDTQNFDRKTSLNSLNDESSLDDLELFNAYEDDELSSENDPESDVPQENMQSSPALADVPLTLHFDIGQRNMTLSEIAALTPGVVVQIDRTLPKLVNITLNEQLIGRGELVQIEDRIGVQITEFLGGD